MARARLRGRAPSAERLREHDRHRPWVVLPVLAALLVYCWCYTHVAQWLGVPTPQDVVDGLGLALPEVIDQDGDIDAKLRVSHTRLFGSDDERLIGFAALFACFLSAYFLPLRHKKPAIVAWFFAAFAVLYGPRTALTLLTAHLTIYLLFHPTAPRTAAIAGAWAGLLTYLSLGDIGAAPAAAWTALAATAGASLYARLAAVLAAGGRAVAALRTGAIQACMITILVASAHEGLTGQTWTLPVGLVAWFYQWARLMVYRADYTDGEVPRDLALGEYLAVFLSPAGLFNLAYAPYLGQGYVYLRERHLAADKSALALSGVRLWCLALVYMVLAEQATQWFIAATQRILGVEVHAYTSELVRAHLRGDPISAPTVLLSTLVDQARIFLIYGGVTHFRVGAWRVLGYAMDTQYDRPWLATNLAALWGRFAFHFREFLVRVFYYPVFFTCFRRRPVARLVCATMVATVLGNLVWGHVPPATISHLKWSSFTRILSTWPYFLLLGLGISLTQVWLLRRPRARKPWTLDRRLPLDLLCAYATFQYFSLIHIYIRPQPGGSLAASTRLLLTGLGLER